MATATLEFAAIDGLTLTAELYAGGSDVLVTSAACTERSNNRAVYTASLVDVATGTYRLRVRNASNQTIMQDWLDHTNAAGVEYPFNSRLTGTGTGARSVTLTVNDGTTPLQNARVRLQQGAESYVDETDVNGQIVFSVNDATWSVRITKPGYSFTPTTLLVNSDETQTYSMSVINPPAPSIPDVSVGTAYTYDYDMTIEVGATVTFRMIDGEGSTGRALDGGDYVLTSDQNGLITGEFLIGATYKGRRGSRGDWVEFTVADSPSFLLPETLGAP